MFYHAHYTIYFNFSKLMALSGICKKEKHLLYIQMLCEKIVDISILQVNMCIGRKTLYRISVCLKIFLENNRFSIEASKAESRKSKMIGFTQQMQTDY